MTLTLRLPDDSAVVDPSPAQIEESLRSLPGGDGSFAIVERSADAFMQVAGGGDDGFELLEYRDEASGRLWQCRDDLQRERVIRAFLRYAQGGDEHTGAFEWTPVGRVNTIGFDAVIKVVTLVIIAGLSLVFIRFVLWLNR